jgi:hypothetical protein
MKLATLLPALTLTAVGVLAVAPPTAAVPQAMPAAITAEVVAAPIPLVPNAITIATNNDDSDRSFRYHYPTSSSTAQECRGSYRVLAPGYTTEAWVSDVNSMRFYEDARVVVRSLDGTVTYKIWGINVPSGGSVCYKYTTNYRRYDVLSEPGAHVGADPYPA